ncbi:MAG: alpha/beta fold hydrolase [Thermoanaerobaculales bacterium]
MTFRLGIAIAALHLTCSFGPTQLYGQSALKPAIPYGDNKDAGHYAALNGVRLYYETYGQGDPLVLIHGNGGNIAFMGPQIEYFRNQYKVIVLDCRGRGKSELGEEPLTYMQMTKDVAVLLDSLKVESAYIVGRSDGGIIGLMMGIYFPERTRKIAAFGANLTPDATAIYPHIIEEIHADRVHAGEMMKRGDTTTNWRLIRELNSLMEFQPHISPDDLRKIKCPVLVMSCDRDVVREEHTLYIYRNIREANLCIVPGETHWITKTDPALFKATVAKFFSEPFRGEEIRK